MVIDLATIKFFAVLIGIASVVKSGFTFLQQREMRLTAEAMARVKQNG